jgi:hypothetical protein
VPTAPVAWSNKPVAVAPTAEVAETAAPTAVVQPPKMADRSPNDSVAQQQQQQQVQNATSNGPTSSSYPDNSAEQDRERDDLDEYDETDLREYENSDTNGHRIMSPNDDYDSTKENVHPSESDDESGRLVYTPYVIFFVRGFESQIRSW